MNRELASEFNALGREMARIFVARLENHALHLKITSPDQVAELIDATMGWVAGFLNGCGYDRKATDASLAQAVTVFRRFYTSELLKN